MCVTTIAPLKEVPFKQFAPQIDLPTMFLCFSIVLFLVLIELGISFIISTPMLSLNPVLPCLLSCVFLWDPDWEDVPITLSGPGRAGFHIGHLGRQCGGVFPASSWVVCASYLRSPFP